MDRSPVSTKRRVAAGHYEFTLKADLEQDVIESILTDQFFRVKDSRSLWRRGRRGIIYFIESFDFEGIPIYSKGVVRRIDEHDSDLYILISGKRSVRSD